MYSSLELLRQLKEDYGKGLVSALVGAGMSSNAYKAYPDWNELLGDVVLYVFKDEYDVKLTQYKANPEPDRSPEKSALNAVISKYGSLEIVSEYIKRKGIGHEAIDAYIEDKIPSLQKVKKHWEINGSLVKMNDLRAHEALLRCEKFSNIYTTNYDNLLEASQVALGLKLFNGPVINAEGLSDSLSSRSIIKIHGSLRAKKSDAYEFDHDKNLLYIISKEDYDTYLEKHEAFSLLMRLAMLRGKFLLVGFSGDDPNYMQWLQWMKDILDNAPCRKDVADTKVYIISVSEKSFIPKDKQLFYENHHVGVINLYDVDVIGELMGIPPILDVSGGKIPSASKKYDKADLLKEFFENLQKAFEKDSGSDVVEEKKGTTICKSNSTYRSEYNQLWSELEDSIRAGKDSQGTINRIKALRPSYSVPKIVLNQERVVSALVSKKSALSNQDVDAFLMACLDMGLLPEMFESYSIGDYVSGRPEWNKLIQREQTLHLNSEELLEGNDDWVIYENALRLAYHFRFRELKNLLRDWKPEGEYIQKKAVMTTLFEYDDSYVKPLSNYIEKERLKNPILGFNASFIADMIISSYPPKYPLDEYWDMGLASIGDILKYIVGNIKGKSESIQPFGNIRESIPLTPSNTRYLESVRLLQDLIGWGISPYHRISSVLSSNDWYVAFKNLYKIFPLPCLYYSVQYKDKGFLKRVAQMFAFDSDLAMWADEFLPILLDSINDKHLPNSFWYGLIVMTGEMYVAVPEDKWFDSFVKNILQPMLNDWEKIDENAELFKNASKALSRIKTKENVEAVLDLLWSNMSKNPHLTNVIVCDNLNLGFLSKESPGLGEKFDDVIRNYSLEESYSLLYAASHYSLLSESQMSRIIEKTKKEGLEFAKTNYVALIQLSYLYNDNDLRNIIKSYILNLNVWNCGISEKISSQPVYFHIDRLSPSILWTPDEKKELFANMAENLKKLESHVPSGGFDHFLCVEYISLLYSMKMFYEANEGEVYYPEIKDKLVKRIMVEQGYNDKIPALLDDNTRNIVHALDDMNISIGRQKDISPFVSEISLILDRILLCYSAGNNLLLSEVSYLVKDFTIQMVETYREKLKAILQVYQDVDYDEMNIYLPFTCEHLNSIANSLANYQDFDAVASYWLTNKNVLRFVS